MENIQLKLKLCKIQSQKISTTEESLSLTISQCAL
jgi:hypothetical protein